MEFKKYALIIEWEEANRPLSVPEKAVLTRLDLESIEYVLSGM